MMKKTGFLIFFLPSLLLFSSCSTEGNICNETIPVTSLEEIYGCANTAYQMEIDLTEDYTIIRSQTEFEEQVAGSCLPQIDFSKYSLVIGKKWLSNGLVSINYRLIKECNKNKSILFVTFKTGMFTNAPNVTYHALIPRLAEGETIDVQIID